MAGEVHEESIRDLLSMFGKGGTEGTVTGGKFVFTEADMVTIRQNWLDLADSYRASLDNAGRMARIRPPADDMASTFHADAANRSGHSYKTYLEHNRDYCLQQAQLFHDAIADYLGVEHTNVVTLNRTSDAGAQDGV